jgi:glycosyltransferase involved in cell wall biosynthesis
MNRVSVIVPTYGRAAWCEQAVRSALAQEGVDVEVVVALDGEQEETRRRVEALGDSRVRVVAHAHAGHGATRNLGLGAATADLVAFLDDDDALLPGALAARAGALARHPDAVLVYGLPVATDAAGREEPGGRARAARGAETCEARLEAFLRGRPTPFASAVLARRAAVDRAGRFDADLPVGEDWAFSLRLAAEGPFVFLPTATVLYRRHAGQTRADPGAQEAGIERFAARYFDNPRTPEAARRRRDGLLGLHYNWIARNYRRSGDLASYRRCFRRAVSLRPSLLWNPRRALRYLAATVRVGSTGRDLSSGRAARGGDA